MQSLSKTFTLDVLSTEVHENKNSTAKLGENEVGKVDGQTLPIIQQLCDALEASDIRYCHWKSNAALDRSANGQNDLDLLVARHDRERFSTVISRLGFKEANHTGEAHLPGVISYYAHDPLASRLVHAHIHYQLVVGHDRTKNYCLGIEDAYLASASKAGIFYIPTPEFEFVVFVLRMVLKYSTWDAILGGQAKLPDSAKREWHYLLERIDQSKVYAILENHLPSIRPAVFDLCSKAIAGNCSVMTKIKAGRLLQQAMQAYTRRSPAEDLFLKGWRRLENAIRRRLHRTTHKARMAGGGTMIAIVGGDGAGKSTAITSLYKWLSKDLDTKRLHLGKPRRSLSTQLVRNSLKLISLPTKLFTATDEQKMQDTEKFPGYGALLLQLCIAQDRYWAYVQARRFVNDGGILICDRYPLAQIKQMDGPRIEQMAGDRAHQSIIRWMINCENQYYQCFAQPEALIILRLDPLIAVQRKIEESPALVQRRAEEIWQADWHNTNAYVIDAAKSKEEVLSTIKTLVWLNL